MFKGQFRGMAFSVLVFFLFLVLGWRPGLVASQSSADNTSFDKNYQVTWGFDHVLSLNQGREVQLSMDTSSGYCLIFILLSTSNYYSIP